MSFFDNFSTLTDGLLDTVMGVQVTENGVEQKSEQKPQPPPADSAADFFSDFGSDVTPIIAKTPAKSAPKSAVKQSDSVAKSSRAVASTPKSNAAPLVKPHIDVPSADLDSLLAEVSSSTPEVAPPTPAKPVSKVATPAAVKAKAAMILGSKSTPAKLPVQKEEPKIEPAVTNKADTTTGIRAEPIAELNVESASASARPAPHIDGNVSSNSTAEEVPAQSEVEVLVESVAVVESESPIHSESEPAESQPATEGPAADDVNVATEPAHAESVEQSPEVVQAPAEDTPVSEAPSTDESGSFFSSVQSFWGTETTAATPQSDPSASSAEAPTVDAVVDSVAASVSGLFSFAADAVDALSSQPEATQTAEAAPLPELPPVEIPTPIVHAAPVVVSAVSVSSDVPSSDALVQLQHQFAESNRMLELRELQLQRAALQLASAHEQLEESERKQSALQAQLKEVTVHFAAARQESIELETAGVELATVKADNEKKDARIASLAADLESAQRSLDQAETQRRLQRDAIAQHEASAATMTAEIEELKNELSTAKAQIAERDTKLERAQERASRALEAQAAADEANAVKIAESAASRRAAGDARVELDRCRHELTVAAEREAALQAQLQAAAEVRAEHDKKSIQWAHAQKEHAMLISRLSDLQRSLDSLQSSAATREESLRADCASLRMSLEQAEMRAHLAQNSAVEATQPLLKQLDAAHAQLRQKSQHSETSERALLAQLAAAKSETEKAVAAHASTTSKLNQLQLEFSTLVSAIERERNSNAQAQKHASVKLEDLEQVCQTLRERIATLETQQQVKPSPIKGKNNDSELVAELREQLDTLKAEQHELLLQLRAERDRNSANEQQRLNRPTTPAPDAAVPVMSDSADALLAQTLSSQSQSSLLQHSVDGSDENEPIDENAAPAVLLDRLTAALRRREKECSALKLYIVSLESTRNTLSDQLVTISARVHAQEVELRKQTSLQTQLQDTHRRYLAAVEVVAEKELALQELQSDLDDLKQVYRTQTQELLARIGAPAATNSH